MDMTTVGIDLPKKMFSVHGVDAHGKVLLKKTVSRDKLLECFAKPMNERGARARILFWSA